MKKDIKELEEKAHAILGIIEDTIKEGPWDASNFLKAIGNRLRGIHETLASKLNIKTTKVQEEATKDAVTPGYKKIYISLYSTQGNQLQVWERIIMNLPKQIISRPIYANEDDIQASMRTKENKNNEAYVSLVVKDTDILNLPPDKTPKDKLGKPLLTLKDKAIKLENIHQFVHMSGIYEYNQGRLIKL